MEDKAEILDYLQGKVNSKLEFNLSLVADLKPLFELKLHILDNLMVVKEEICYCQLFHLYQASITSTNFLLEKALKTSLIFWEFGYKKIDDIQTMDTDYKLALDKYSNMDLSKTINISCTKGLISKPEKKLLHDFRERLRNGFSHSDSRKIFKDVKIPMWMGKLGMDSKNPVEYKEIQISDVPHMEKHALHEFAKYNSLNYFKNVIQIIENLESKLSDKTIA